MASHARGGSGAGLLAPTKYKPATPLTPELKLLRRLNLAGACERGRAGSEDGSAVLPSRMHWLGRAARRLVAAALDDCGRSRISRCTPPMRRRRTKQDASSLWLYGMITSGRPVPFHLDAMGNLSDGKMPSWHFAHLFRRKSLGKGCRNVYRKNEKFYFQGNSCKIFIWTPYFLSFGRHGELV